MDKLTHWTARRAGGRITVKGRDNTGVETKITGGDAIAIRDRRIIATVKGGDEIELAPA